MDQSENAGWQSEAMISLRNLRVSYGEHEILHGISFDVQRGETLVILGGSGSGKSTLLRTLVGLESPTSGEIWLKGKNIAAISAAEMDEIRKKVGMSFQGGRCLVRCRWERMLRCRFASTPSWKTRPSKSY